MLEKILERIIFSSRWLLAPFYLVMILGLIGLLIKAGQAAFHFAAMDLAHASDRELIWTVGIHLVFVLTSFLLAFTDKIAADQDHG